MHDKILILDFGSQVTQLIARRIREAHVYCEIHPYDKVDGMLDAFAPKAVILSGGPASVHEAESPAASKRIFELDVPVLGICYGEMTMCAELGGAAGAHQQGGRSREPEGAWARDHEHCDRGGQAFCLLFLVGVGGSGSSSAIVASRSPIGCGSPSVVSS